MAWCGRRLCALPAQRTASILTQQGTAHHALKLVPHRAIVTMEAGHTVHPKIPTAIKKLMKKEPTDLDAKAAASGFEKPWLLRTAALIERLPVVTPPISDIEMTYKILQAALHKSRAKKYPKDTSKKDAALDAEEDDADEDYASTAKPKAGTLEAFRPAPRITEADTSGDVRSLNRHLIGRLYMVVQSPETGLWSLPSCDYNPEFSFKTGLKNMLAETVGTNMQLYWIGNSPLACYKYEFSDQQKKELKCFGAKLFYFRAQLIRGVPEVQNNAVKDVVWLRHDELGGFLSEEEADYLDPVLPYWHYSG